jgi:hypothetical protein
MYVCADYDGRKQHIPAGCDWYGAYAAKGFQRVEVQAAGYGAILIGIVAIALVLRRLRGSRRALLGLLFALAGLTVGVFGTVRMGSVWHPIGLALYGFGFLLLGEALRRAGTPKLGGATMVIAALALLGAVDTGLVMIPYIAVSPALLRVVAELVWVPWALGAILIGHKETATDTTT